MIENELIKSMNDFLLKFMAESFQQATTTDDNGDSETITWCVQCGSDAVVPGVALTIQHNADCIVNDADALLTEVREAMLGE